MTELAALLLVLMPHRPASEIRWYFHPPRALEVAAHRKLPVMLDLGSVRAGPWGQWMEMMIYANPEMSHLFNQVIPLRITDRQTAQAMMERLGLPQSPSVLFLTPEGQPYWRITGRMRPSSFQREFNLATRHFNQVGRYLETLRSGRGDAEALAGATILAAANGDQERSLELLEAASRARPSCDLYLDACASVGNSLRMKGRHDVSIPWLKKAAVSKDPDLACQSLLSLAWSYWAAKQSEPALQALREVQRIGDPESDYARTASYMMRRISES